MWKSSTTLFLLSDLFETICIYCMCSFIGKLVYDFQMNHVLNVLYKEMRAPLLTSGFAYTHILSYAESEFTLACAHHSFAYASNLQGAQNMKNRQFQVFLSLKAKHLPKPSKPDCSFPSVFRWRCTHEKSLSPSIFKSRSPSKSGYQIIQVDHLVTTMVTTRDGRCDPLRTPRDAQKRPVPPSR